MINPLNKQRIYTLYDLLNKIPVAMRMTLLLLCVFAFQLHSEQTYSQQTKISLNMKNSSIEKILQTIEERSEFYFLYNSKLIDVDRKTNIRVREESIASILNRLFDEEDVEYEVKGTQIILHPKEMSRIASELITEAQQQQKKQITGKITDEQGEPVIGANIIEKGTTNGTVTNIDGNFTFSVEENAVLQISYLGYLDREIDTQGQTSIEVILQEDTRTLEEVVVVGYGVQKKVNLTGAVAAISSEEIADISAATLSSALSGRISGMLVTSSVGKPGGASTTQIRSVGTWNNSSPLYVIDGVVRDQFAFDGLDANEVESISVLKDGASAAIYGARAANGVILVTTKKGTTGKPVIAYTGTVGWSDATKIPDMMDGYNQALVINDALSIRGFDSSSTDWFTDDELEYFRNFNYNWVEEAWKQPLVTRHSLNVNGGSEAVRYFVGGNYLYETGSFDNLAFQKYNFRGSIEADITKDLVVGLNLANDVRNDDKPFWRWDSDSDMMPDLYKGLLFRSQMIPAYIDGQALREVGGTTFVEWSPMEVINGNTGFNKKKYITSEVTATTRYNVPFVEGLNVSFLYNRINRNTHVKQFNFPYLMYNFRGTGTHGHIPTNEVVGTYTRNDGNYLLERQVRDESYQLNAQINYANTFGKHDIGALFVYEQWESSQNLFSAQGYDFPSMDIPHLNAAGRQTMLITGSGVENVRMSYIGRVNYGYDQKYLLEASFRYDGSANFAPGKRWGFFPSVSAAWRISEEDFFKNNVSFIDYLKFRGSVGLLGNDAVAAWQWYQKYRIPTSGLGAVFGGTTTTGGLLPDVLANPNITWEKTQTVNIGADTQFLDNRLSVNFDYFFKHTYDILGSRQQSLPTTFGAQMPAENYAVIDGHGWEIEAEWNQRVNQDFSYYARGNFSFAVNKVKVYDEAENLRAYQSLLGHNYDRINGMGYIATDIIRTQADLDALPENYTIFGRRPELGMLNYRDIRGANSDEPDGVIDDNDLDWVIRNRIPPYTFGMALGTKWRNWSLDLFFQGVAGNDVMIAQRDPERRAAATTFDFWRDRWTPDNINAAFPRIEENQSGVASTFWRRDGSFVRLKNVNLSYDLPAHLTNRMGMNRARIFFTGNNLFLLYDKVKYFDPELGANSNNIVNYPLMKNYSFGINVSF